MGLRKKRARWLFGGGLVVLLFAWLGLDFAEKKIAESLTGHCGAECETSVSRVRLRLSGIYFYDFHFVTGHPQKSQWRVDIPEARIVPSFAALLQKQPVLRYAHLQSPRVILEEGEEKSLGPKPAPPGFIVEKLELEDASFRYEQNFHGRKGSIALDQIQVRADAFGTMGMQKDAKTKAQAEARLEHSGKVKLSFTAKLFQRDPDLDLHLELSGQNLGEVNHYFQPIDGIQLQGHLYQASADLHSDGQGEAAKVHARYDKLDVHFLQVAERSPLTTFFSNLFRGLKLIDGNLHDAPAHAKGEARLTRKPQEGMVSFVLRGLKEALMAVAAP